MKEMEVNEVSEVSEVNDNSSAADNAVDVASNGYVDNFERSDNFNTFANFERSNGNVDNSERSDNFANFSNFDKFKKRRGAGLLFFFCLCTPFFLSLFLDEMGDF